MSENPQIPGRYPRRSYVPPVNLNGQPPLPALSSAPMMARQVVPPIAGPTLPVRDQVLDYQRFVADFNREAVLSDIRQHGRFKLSPGDTHRLLTLPEEEEVIEQTESEVVANSNWRLFQDSVRQTIVWRNVNRFIYKIKDLPVRKNAPKLVRDKLQPKLAGFWEDDTLGWNPWRPDVVFNDITHYVFNWTALFFFSVRTVLYKVDMGAFPMLYIIVLLMNAFYRCNTKILYLQHVIVRRKKIIIHYLTYYSILDFTLIYLCILQLCRVQTSWYRMIIFLKLFDNKRVMHKLEQISDIVDYGVLIVGVIKVYIIIVSLAHCVALVFITMVSKDKHPNWMDSFNYTRDMDHWITVYIRAFYWAMSTLTLSTFGDTTPQRTKQVIFVIIVDLFGIAVVAYWLGALQTLFNAIRASSLACTKNLRLMNRFLQANKVPYRIQKRVKQTVYFKYKSFRVQDVQEQNDLIETLSPWLRDRLLENVHTNPMMTMPLWNRFSMQTIKSAATQCIRKLYYGTQLVIAQKQVPDKFYMLRNGRIFQSYVDKTMFLTKVGRLDYIHGVIDKFNKLQTTVPSHYLWLGVEYTINQIESPISIISNGQSVIISIQRKKVIDILKESEDNEDYESFCLFRDDLKFGVLKMHQVSCLHCPGADHNTLQCPYYHFIPRKGLVLLKYIKRKDQRRRYQLKERVLQPRIKGNDTRRGRFPLLKIGNGEQNVVIGSLSANHALNNTIEKYRNLSKKKLKHYHSPNQNDINDYLTTEPDVDLPYEWKVYFTKFNASRINLRRGLY